MYYLWFHFPRPPSAHILIAREAEAQELSSEEEAQGKAALVAVREVLDAKDTPDEISLDDVLDKAGVSHDTYCQGLKICSRGNSIVLQRKPSESWINAFNPNVIYMDLHGVSKCPHRAAHRVCSAELERLKRDNRRLAVRL